MSCARRLTVCLTLTLALGLPAGALAAPALKAPQKEHRLTPGARTGEKSRASGAQRAAQQPSNALEALHYFRDRLALPESARDPKLQGELRAHV